MKAVVTKPVIYTFRSQSEGGVRTEPMSSTTWRKKVLAAIDSKLFDAVDIEFDRGRAEFLVEAYGDPNYKDGYPMSAKEAVDIVRSRVHVDMPPFPNNLTLNEFKAKLRNERRVELSFEDHRFWDIRRWKIADQTTDIYGVDITKKEDGSFSYKKVLVEKRIFKDCMYLYPIPQSERYINPELEQNPGW